MPGQVHLHVNKCHDYCAAELRPKANATHDIDEIKQFQNFRYITPRQVYMRLVSIWQQYNCNSYIVVYALLPLVFIDHAD